MKFILSMLLLLPLSTFAQDESSKELEQLIKKSADKRSAETDDYQEKNPNWENSKAYADFLVKQENEEFKAQSEAYDSICQKYKQCESADKKSARALEKDYYVQYYRLSYDANQKAVAGKINEKEVERIEEAHRLNHQANLCAKFQTGCESLEKDKAAYKSNFGAEFVAAVVAAPSVPAKDKVEAVAVVSADEVIEVKKPFVKPEISDEVETPSPIEPVTSKVSDNSKKPVAGGMSYKPETCEWAQDLPRRIVKGPGCDKDGSQICVGFVVCEEKSGQGKFVRMSTCSKKFCGKNDAVACTKQKGYGSSKPKEVTNPSVSEPVKSILEATTRQ